VFFSSIKGRNLTTYKLILCWKEAVDDENSAINLNAVEISNNGIDEDCDGMDATTSVTDLTDSSVNVYPNPANNAVFVEVTAIIDYEITLFSIDGKRLHVSINQPVIPVRHLPSSTYIVVVTDLATNKKVHKKLIKMD